MFPSYCYCIIIFVYLSEANNFIDINNLREKFSPGFEPGPPDGDPGSNSGPGETFFS